MISVVGFAKISPSAGPPRPSSEMFTNRMTWIVSMMMKITSFDARYAVGDSPIARSRR